MAETQAGGNALGAFGIVGEHVGGQAELGVVTGFNDFLFRAEQGHGYQRTEGFFLVAAHIPVYTVYHGGWEEQVVAKIFRFLAGHQGRAFFKSVLHVAFDLVVTSLIDQGAKIHVAVDAVTDGHFVDPLGKLFTEGIGHFLMHENPVGTNTGLAATAEFVGDKIVCRSVQIGVVKDNERRVAAQLQSQFLDLIRRVDNQLATHFSGAGEAEHGHIRAFAQNLADHAGLAHHQVDHAVGYVGVLVHQAEQGNHGERGFTGRLDDRRTAGRQGRRQLLGDHANGKVPGRDQAGDTNGAVVDGPGAIFRLFRNGVGVQGLDVLGAVIEETGSVIHLALGFVQGFAMLHTQDPADLLLVGLECVPDIFQPFPAGLDAVGAGQPKGRLAGCDGGLHFILWHGCDLGDHLARCRVINVEGVAMFIVSPATTDIAGQLFQQG